jgi:hypothetical protein
MAAYKTMKRQIITYSAPPAVAYFLFYLFFTGAAQLMQTPRIGITSIVFVYTFVETQLYTGPLLQVVGDGFVFNLRLYPMLLGVVVSALVGYNAGLLFTLYRRGMLRTCLLGTAWSGVGGLLASIISFGYLCCGWPVSLIFFGVAAVTALSPILTAAAVTLLAINAYILTKRIQTLEKLKNTEKTRTMNTSRGSSAW